MGTITVKDGTTIYYKDWGTGQPVVFSHGWPLSADAWEDQMIFLADRGYRCIAHDRRGHGRSSQPSNGNDMNTYADDLLALVEALDLSNAVHVGHSTGGGEVARYIGRHGTKRVSKAVLRRIQTGCPWKRSTAFARACCRTGHSSSRISAARSTAPIAPARKCRKGCAIRSGCWVCRRASKASSTASRPSLKQILRKT